MAYFFSLLFFFSPLLGSVLHDAVASKDLEKVIQVLNASEIEHFFWGVKIDGKNTHGYTPLMIAAIKDELAIGEQLLKHGAKLEETDHNGNTSLMLAAAFGSLDFMQLLLREGSRVNTVNKKGASALMLAADLNSKSPVNLLLQNNADFRFKDDQDETALAKALSSGKNYIAKEILRASFAKKLKLSDSDIYLMQKYNLMKIKGYVKAMESFH